jgi:hypothetical protein
LEYDRFDWECGNDWSPLKRIFMEYYLMRLRCVIWENRLKNWSGDLKKVMSDEYEICHTYKEKE